MHVKSDVVAEGECSRKHDVMGKKIAVKLVTDVNSVAIQIRQHFRCFPPVKILHKMTENFTYYRIFHRHTKITL